MSIFDDAWDFVEDVAGFAADVATGGAYSSYKAQRKAKKNQKKQQKQQEEVLKKQKEEALTKRKQQIDQLREQRAGNTYSTRHTSAKGVKGRLYKDEERLG